MSLYAYLYIYRYYHYFYFHFTYLTLTYTFIYIYLTFTIYLCSSSQGGGGKGVLYSPSGGPAGSRRASQPPPRPHPPGPLNKALKKKTMDITFSADAATMRVTIDCGAAKVTGVFLQILGWPKGASLQGKQKSPGFRDITRGVRSAFVYVDCIQPTNAGSFQVQLLMEVPTRTHKPSDVIHWRAQMPVEKHVLNTQTLSQLKVSIKDIHDQVLDFNGFNVNLLLAIEHRPR